MTAYRKSHDQRGRIAILVDGKEVHQSNDIETESAYSGFFMPGENDAMRKAYENGALHTQLFEEAYHNYSNQDINTSIHSPNALVRLFAIFDRRIGIHSFAVLRSAFIGNALCLEPFYAFRLECEKELYSHLPEV